MSGFTVALMLLFVVSAVTAVITTPAPVTEQPAVKVSCVRVKHVADGGKIEYICEVRK